MMTPTYRPHGRSLIDGVPVEPAGTTFESRSRIDGTLLGTFTNASDDQVRTALKLGAGAFFETAVLSPRTPDDQAKLLMEILRAFEARLPDIKAAGCHELAYPAARADGETARAMFQFRIHAEAARRRKRLFPSISIALDKSINVRSLRVPRGVAVNFPSTNFPWGIGVVGPDLIEPFREGCPVVVKASSKHPLTSELMGEAVVEAVKNAGYPPGFFSLIQSSDRNHGGLLMSSAEVAVAGLTGGAATGRRLSAVAIEHGAILHGELGAVNPVFVFPEKMRNHAASFAENWWSSLTLGNGQFCTCPGIVFVPDDEGIVDFERTLRAKMDAAEPSTLLHANTQASFDRNLDALQSVEGVETWIRSPKTGNGGAVCLPRILKTTGKNFLRHAQAMQQEVFGPVGLVVVTDSVDEMIEAAQLLHGQLTASLFGTSGDLESSQARRLERVLAFLKAGRVNHENMPTGVAVVPSMVHSGPPPASTQAETSIGLSSRYSRPVCFQNERDDLLLPELQDENPLGIEREVFVTDRPFGKILFWETTIEPLSKIMGRLSP
jgi:NADP-dependent aldehyde dehydrogenase